MRPRALRTVIVIVAALAVAGLVAACGSFDSKASGEHLIRNYVSKFGKGQATLKSVNCPSNVAQKNGSSYNCKVVLKNVRTGQLLRGSITVHIASGNKVEILGSQDVHVG